MNMTQHANNNIHKSQTGDETALKRQISFMNIHQPSSFLPFTGVDQPFMMHRPVFSRVSPLIPEKLNDMGQQHLQTALNNVGNTSQIMSSMNYKTKAKLVYDSTYLQNIEMAEQDCRLYVPLVFRK